MRSALLKDLLVATKDGDWGSDAPAEDLAPRFVIRGADFPNARIMRAHSVPHRYLPLRTVDRRTLRAGDILLETAGGSRDRPTGRTLFVTQELLDAFSEPVIGSSFTRFLRVNEEIVVPTYLFWYLQHIYARGETNEYQVQHTGVARFQYTVFANSKQIPLPALAEQRAIGEVLGALDDKIAANDRVIATAEELARSLFRASVNSVSVPLSSLARFVNGKAFTKDASGTGRVVIRIAELNSGIGASTVYNDIEVHDDHLARPGDLLFAWSGSLTAARWFRPEAIVNQHIFKVIPNDGTPKWLVNEAVHAKLDEFKAIAADKATTMGHIQRRHLDEAVGVPAADEVERIDVLMTGLWEAALAAEIESLKLAETRDQLLPLLMSGKVRVREAEKVVEGAL
jgi:type I restriction enzyme S subunit